MKKSISIVLAFVLLFSSIGLAKSTHICMGEESMHEFGLSVQHLNCGMESQKHEQIPSNEAGTMSAEECCENEFDLLQTDVEQQYKSFHSDSPQLIFITSFAQVFLLGEDPISSDTPPFSIPIPPLLRQDFSVWYQIFLI